MRCLHPIKRKYVDVAGIEHYQEVPCGKCIACLHSQQDSWLVRLRETAFAYKDFVYDTLTFSPESLTLYDVTSDVLSKYEKVFAWKGVGRLLDKYSRVNFDTGELRYFVPYVARNVIRDWIRRARELYFYNNKKRLKIKYFIVYENGPVWSRPHFHLLMWGISQADYLEYFASRWREQFGFTKTHYITGGTDGDRERITRYISKYVSKGVFESPLVTCGLLPKPWRSISHGIGEEYLQSNFFDWFRGSFAAALRSLCVDKTFRSGDIKYSERVKDFIFSEKSCYKETYSVVERVFRDIGNRLTTYYDSGGYPHALPRYYRYKLVDGFKPNVLSYALQTYLLESARVFYNSRLQRFALGLGFRVDFSQVETPFAGFTSKLYDLLSRKFVIAERVQSKIAAKGRYIELKNHYGRALNLPAYMVG